MTIFRLGMFAKETPEGSDVQLDEETKIFYCSRTHSQLTQFVNEIRRVKLRAPSWIGEATESTGLAQVDPSIVKHLPLGSRKNLCINPKVSKLSSAVAINERCLELQQQGTPQAHKCTFVPTKENEPLVHSFRDHTLAKVRDIEDLGALGEKIGICPYYATRATIKTSEVSNIQKYQLRLTNPC